MFTLAVSRSSDDHGEHHISTSLPMAVVGYKDAVYSLVSSTLILQAVAPLKSV